MTEQLRLDRFLGVRKNVITEDDHILGKDFRKDTIQDTK